MNQDVNLYEELARANATGEACALATVISTKGSTPRRTGSKMIVYSAGRISGTIGGGKFEALVIESSLAAIESGTPITRVYPLHERSEDSFGAICGGEVTVYIEPQGKGPRLFLVGAGHCAQAIANAAQVVGYRITVIDDRPEWLETFPSAITRIGNQTAADVFASTTWMQSDAVVIVSRNYNIDRDALRSVLGKSIGYVGMIGSERKVKEVLGTLREEGADPNTLSCVFAPIGLDVGADSPAEIAVSVIAQILQVRNHATGRHLDRSKNDD